MNLKHSRILSEIFSRAWHRHINQMHRADYEGCCHSPLCRLAWFAERWIWYGGEL